MISWAVARIYFILYSFILINKECTIGRGAFILVERLTDYTNTYSLGRKKEREGEREARREEGKKEEKERGKVSFSLQSSLGS